MFEKNKLRVVIYLVMLFVGGGFFSWAYAAEDSSSKDKNSVVHMNSPQQVKTYECNLPDKITKKKDEAYGMMNFTNKDLYKEYESSLLKYEQWRFEYLEKIHKDQRNITKRYSNFNYWSLWVVGVFLIVSLFITAICKNKNPESEKPAIIEGYGFKVRLMINGTLLVLVLVLLFMQYLYITQMYPIT